MSDLKTNEEGHYVTASNASTLIDAFETILRTVSNETATFAAPALSINTFNRFYNGNDIYLALFTPSVRPLWNGNIKNFKICDDPDACTLGEIMYEDASNTLQIATEMQLDKNKRVLKDTAISNWTLSADSPDGDIVTLGGAGSKVPVPNSRNVYTYTGTDESPTPYVALNADAHKVVTTNTSMATLTGIADATERNNLIAWIRGEDVENTIENATERWRIGDPLHSSPLAINFGIDTTLTPNEAVAKLIVGTNDGGVRMINAYNGAEEWLFIPKELMDDQNQLRINSGTSRFYGIDGVPAALVHDVDKDGIIEPASNEYVHMYIGMRRGGSSYYALDITPGSTITSAALTNQINPKFMWRIGADQTGFERLGQTWSRPVPTSILMTNASDVVEAREVVIFGGGYDTALDGQFALDTTGTKGNAIYIADAKTGELIWWASSSNVSPVIATKVVTDMKYAIPSDLSVFDSDGDGYSDRIYVADMAGQVWRVDLASDMKTGINNSTKVAKLVALSDTVAAANKRRFFYPPDIIQMIDHNFSSEPRYDLVILASGDRARPLHTAETDRIFAIRDYFPDSIPDTGYGVLLADLVNVTANDIQSDNETTRNNATAALKADSKRGWYIDLEDTGEKGISKGITLDNKYFLTTFTPTDTSTITDACKLNSEGEGRLYGISILHGGSVINWEDSDAPVDTATKDKRYLKLGGGIPSEVVPVFQKEGVTLITGLHSAPANIPDTRYRTYWSETDEEVVLTP